MYNFRLAKDTNFDFVLSKDAVEYVRDYSQYEAFYIDVTQSLYSTIGTTLISGVTLNNINLTGYDNGLLTRSLPSQYIGNVVANNYHTYTFSGDQNWAYVVNDYVYPPDYYGFTGNKNLLIEFKPPVIQTNNDSIFFVLYDYNANFYLYIPFSYNDGISSHYDIYDNNGNTSGIIMLGDVISYFVNNNILYVQKNGVTIRTNENTNKTPDYRFELGAYSSISGVTYTVNDFFIYFQDNKYTGTTYNITDLNPKISGVTLNLPKTTFKLTPVTGYTQGYDYSIINKVMNSVKQPYNQLYGGFYQGFFKLFGYPVEYFKTRANKGWTVNMLLALTSGTTTGTTLNNLHSTTFTNNPMSGMVFYMGTRAENKYLSITGSAINNIVNEVNLVDTTVLDVTTEPISQIFTDTNLNLFDKSNLYTYGNELLLNGEEYTGFYYISNGVYYVDRGDNINSVLTRKTNSDDIINNAFAIFFNNGYVGYRIIYATDPCYVQETTYMPPILDADAITEDSFFTMNNICGDKNQIRKIVTKDFTIEEVMSTQKKLNITNHVERFIYVSVVFERDFTYNTDCDLKYGKYKNGILTIYINGTSVFSYDNFTEIIPHELDTTEYLQEGVPFNISFGGGTQGLIEEVNSVGDGISSTTNRILDKFFSYNFVGGVKAIQMYMTPLNIIEIRNNFNNINNNYGIQQFVGGRFTYHKNLY